MDYISKIRVDVGLGVCLSPTIRAYTIRRRLSTFESILMKIPPSRVAPLQLGGQQTYRCVRSAKPAALNEGLLLPHTPIPRDDTYKLSKACCNSCNKRQNMLLANDSCMRLPILSWPITWS